MFCRNCSTKLDDKAIACTSCGLNPLSESKFCQECGGETKANQVVCIKCGCSLKTSQTKSGYEGFYRSSDDKVIFGLCGGLAHKFKMPVLTVRILTIVSGFFLIGWLYLLAPTLPAHSTKS